MKKLFRPIASLMAVITLALGSAFTVFAASSSITYEGGAENFVFLPGSEYTSTDLFNNFKDVMPGDTLQQKITIQNQSGDSDYIKIYMRAVAHDENGNPLTYSEIFENTDGKDQTQIEGQRDENVVTMMEFLSTLSMTIWNGSEVIYQASPDELDGFSSNVLLGEFENGESTELTVELSVPIELGNEFANRVGEVDWVFVAEELNNPEDNVKTGDSNNIILWIILMVAAVITGVTVVIYKRNKMGL